jgi:hypothetical protein
MPRKGHQDKEEGVDVPSILIAVWGCRAIILCLFRNFYFHNAGVPFGYPNGQQTVLE